jgi:acyl carrier protein
MNQSQIIGHLKKIFIEVFEIETFGIDRTMEEISEWDSLKHLQLLSSIEDHFGIEIQFNDSIEMISVKEIIRIVEKYLYEDKNYD